MTHRAAPGPSSLPPTMTFPDRFLVISDEVSQDLPVLRAFLREFRLPGLELRSFNGRAFKDLTDADVASLAAAKREDGWQVAGCATPVFKCDLEDAAAVQQHRELFRRSVDIAHRLDCSLLRVFTFLRQPNPLEPQRLARIREHLLGLAELAQGSGVRIGVENEHSCFTATADEMKAVLAGLPADRFGAIWDPCNVLYVPGAAAPSPADLAVIGDRLIHIHLKDALRRSRTLTQPAGPLPAIAMPIGAGEVDWRAHLQALHTAGYRGLLSLETHWRVQALDESMLHLPAGHAFSHGGEAASRVCLLILRAMSEAL